MSEHEDDFEIPDFIPDEVVDYENFRAKAGFYQTDAEYYETVMDALRQADGVTIGDMAIVPRRMIEDTVKSEYSLIATLYHLLTLPAVIDYLDGIRPGSTAVLESSLARDIIGNEVVAKLIRGAPSAGNID